MPDEATIFMDVDLKTNGGKRIYRTISELESWFKTEIDFWGWLRDTNWLKIRNQRAQQTLRQMGIDYRGLAQQGIEKQIASLNNIATAIDQCKKSPNDTNCLALLQSTILSAYAPLNGTPTAIHSQSPSGQAVALFLKEDLLFAANTLAVFLKIHSEITSSDEAEAIIRVSLYNRGSKDAVLSEKTAMEQLYSEWTTELSKAKKDFQSRLDAMSESHKSALEDNKQQGIDFNKLMTDCSNQTNGLVNSSTKELESIKKTYDDRLALQAPVKYWEAKASKHRLLAFVYTFLSITAFIITGVGLYISMPQVVGTQKLIEVKFHEIGLIVLVATIGVWAIRVFVRLMMSNIHLLDDATERRTMLLTYLALLRRDKLPKDDSRLLILQTLFRPASTGIVKDDASPPFMAQWLKMTTGSDDGSKG
jgi:hypothetical protein